MWDEGMVENAGVKLGMDSTDLQIINEPRHEKTNVLVSDLVRQKPGCTATEDG